MKDIADGGLKEIALARLEMELPPIFARHEIRKLLGGAIAPGTLANLGKAGPPYIFVGRNAVLEKFSFLEWLRGQMKNPDDYGQRKE